MRYWSVPPLLALLGVLASLAPLVAADDPGDLFMQAYQAYKSAEQQEAGGRLEDALQKYRFCASVLEQVRKSSPGYEPLVIDFRLTKSRESIARVQSLKATSISAGDVAALAPPSRSIPPSPRAARVSALVLRLPQLSTSYRIPVPGAAASPVDSVPQLARQRDDSADQADDVIGRGALGALKDRIRTLEMRLGQERQVNEDLNRKLLESTAREQSALTEVDRTKVQAVESQAQLDQAAQALDDVRQANERLSREKGADEKRIASLQSDLEAAHADLEVADEYNGELFAKLTKAAQFIDSSEKIRMQLLADRKELGSRLNGKAVEIAQLKEETSAMVVRNETLGKQAGDSEKLAGKNKELASKLAAAEQQIADLGKNRDERRKIEDGLRGEVESVNKTIASMREQLASGGKRIAELEKQLADTSGATMSATGAMAEENALLKSLVARQINEQARRQQARKLVEEEMEKLQIRSGALVEKLSALGDAEIQLTPRERKLFETPIASVGSNLDFSLVIAKKKEPASDIPEDLVNRAKEANQLFNQDRLGEARAIYAEIAQKAPQSHTAAVNLGITERQLGDFPQAITAFKRALELKADDPFALTNLGKTEYSSGDLSAAVETLQKAVTADSGNHVAHYLLGAALNQNGDQEGARREVNRALDLKPGYLPAVQLSEELGELKPESGRSPAGGHPPAGQ
ncbi:MAG: tetratricopeptide repeat protein [Terrimicrobiaceae bacterium]|nr:tetratricopeptide repeat protein [Terrimicrobiaceae bacterium]